MRSFFSELKRRNVYKAGVAYAVAGWLIVQIATQVLPLFDVSPLALRLLVLVVVAGFPVALVLSWVYELTPDGIVKTDQVAPSESITHRTSQRLNILISGALAIAVLFLLAQRYLLPQKTVESPAAIPDKSIAVLPFENLSEDKANAFFAQGIQDEILTRLAKIGALKVISRTSTEQFASKPGNLSEIARQLGVANILEGSVQRIGDAVHINVQLIQAASDNHIWAEIYNRKLDDIFGVEGEVAGAIAQALNAKLSGAEQAAVADKPTENVAAFEAYLRGRALEDNGYDIDLAIRKADAYADAVRLDPNFALAWASLAMTEAYLYFNGVDPSHYTIESIKQATDTALRLQPQLFEAQLAEGYYHYRVLRDFAAARQSFEAALQQAPNNAFVLWSLGLVERRLGRWDESIAHMEQAFTFNPRDVGLMTALGGETFANLRRFDEARMWLDRALALAPDSVTAAGYKANTYMSEGRLEDAARVLDPFPVANVDPNTSSFRIYLRLLQRRDADAIAEAKAALARPNDSLEGFGPVIEAYKAFAELRTGDTVAARATFADLVTRAEPFKDRRDDTLAPMMLAIGYAGVGRKEDALNQARHALDLFANDGIERPNAEATLAQVQGMTGDRDAAIAAIASLLQEPSGPTPALLRLDPMWDSFRGDAQFEKLAAASGVSKTLAAPQ